MTDPETADAVYIEPLNVEFVERIIAKEKPDGLLPTLGGQTGLKFSHGSLPKRGFWKSTMSRCWGRRFQRSRKPKTARFSGP